MNASPVHTGIRALPQRFGQAVGHTLGQVGHTISQTGPFQTATTGLDHVLQTNLSTTRVTEANTELVQGCLESLSEGVVRQIEIDVEAGNLPKERLLDVIHREETRINQGLFGYGFNGIKSSLRETAGNFQKFGADFMESPWQAVRGLKTHWKAIPIMSAAFYLMGAAVATPVASPILGLIISGVSIAAPILTMFFATLHNDDVRDAFTKFLGLFVSKEHAEKIVNHLKTRWLMGAGAVSLLGFPYLLMKNALQITSILGAFSTFSLAAFGGTLLTYMIFRIAKEAVAFSQSRMSANEAPAKWAGITMLVASKISFYAKIGMMSFVSTMFMGAIYGFAAMVFANGGIFAVTTMTGAYFIGRTFGNLHKDHHEGVKNFVFGLTIGTAPLYLFWGGLAAAYFPTLFVLAPLCMVLATIHSGLASASSATNQVGAIFHQLKPKPSDQDFEEVSYGRAGSGKNVTRLNTYVSDQDTNFSNYFNMFISYYPSAETLFCPEGKSMTNLGDLEKTCAAHHAFEHREAWKKRIHDSIDGHFKQILAGLDALDPNSADYQTKLQEGYRGLARVCERLGNQLWREDDWQEDGEQVRSFSSELLQVYEEDTLSLEELEEKRRQGKALQTRVTKAQWFDHGLDFQFYSQMFMTMKYLAETDYFPLASRLQARAAEGGLSRTELDREFKRIRGRFSTKAVRTLRREERNDDQVPQKTNNNGYGLRHINSTICAIQAVNKDGSDRYIEQIPTTWVQLPNPELATDPKAKPFIWVLREDAMKVHPLLFISQSASDEISRVDNAPDKDKLTTVTYRGLEMRALVTDKERLEIRGITLKDRVIDGRTAAERLADKYLWDQGQRKFALGQVDDNLYCAVPKDRDIRSDVFDPVLITELMKHYKGLDPEKPKDKEELDKIIVRYIACLKDRPDNPGQLYLERAQGDKEYQDKFAEYLKITKGQLWYRGDAPTVLQAVTLDDYFLVSDEEYVDFMSMVFQQGRLLYEAKRNKNLRLMRYHEKTQDVPDPCPERDASKIVDVERIGSFAAITYQETYEDPATRQTRTREQTVPFQCNRDMLPLGKMGDSKWTWQEVTHAIARRDEKGNRVIDLYHYRGPRDAQTNEPTDLTRENLIYCGNTSLNPEDENLGGTIETKEYPVHLPPPENIDGQILGFDTYSKTDGTSRRGAFGYMVFDYGENYGSEPWQRYRFVREDHMPWQIWLNLISSLEQVQDHTGRGMIRVTNYFPEASRIPYPKAWAHPGEEGADRFTVVDVAGASGVVADYCHLNGERFQRQAISEESLPDVISKKRFKELFDRHDRQEVLPFLERTAKGNYRLGPGITAHAIAASLLSEMGQEQLRGLQYILPRRARDAQNQLLPARPSVGGSGRVVCCYQRADGTQYYQYAPTAEDLPTTTVVCRYKREDGTEYYQYAPTADDLPTKNRVGKPFTENRVGQPIELDSENSAVALVRFKVNGEPRETIVPLDGNNIDLQGYQDQRQVRRAVVGYLSDDRSQVSFYQGREHRLIPEQAASYRYFLKDHAELAVFDENFNPVAEGIVDYRQVTDVQLEQKQDQPGHYWVRATLVNQHLPETDPNHRRIRYIDGDCFVDHEKVALLQNSDRHMNSLDCFFQQDNDTYTQATELFRPKLETQKGVPMLTLQGVEPERRVIDLPFGFVGSNFIPREAKNVEVFISSPTSAVKVRERETKHESWIPLPLVDPIESPQSIKGPDFWPGKIVTREHVRRPNGTTTVEETVRYVRDVRRAQEQHSSVFINEDNLVHNDSHTRLAQGPLGKLFSETTDRPDAAEVLTELNAIISERNLLTELADEIAGVELGPEVACITGRIEATEVENQEAITNLRQTRNRLIIEALHRTDLRVFYFIQASVLESDIIHGNYQMIVNRQSSYGGNDAAEVRDQYFYGRFPGAFCEIRYPKGEFNDPYLVVGLQGGKNNIWDANGALVSEAIESGTPCLNAYLLLYELGLASGVFDEKGNLIISNLEKLMNHPDAAKLVSYLLYNGGLASVSEDKYFKDTVDTNLGRTLEYDETSVAIVQQPMEINKGAKQNYERYNTSSEESLRLLLPWIGRDIWRGWIKQEEGYNLKFKHPKAMLEALMTYLWYPYLPYAEISQGLGPTANIFSGGDASPYIVDFAGFMSFLATDTPMSSASYGLARYFGGFDITWSFWHAPARDPIAFLGGYYRGARRMIKEGWQWGYFVVTAEQKGKTQPDSYVAGLHFLFAATALSSLMGLGIMLASTAMLGFSASPYLAGFAIAMFLARRPALSLGATGLVALTAGIAEFNPMASPAILAIVFNTFWGAYKHFLLKTSLNWLKVHATDLEDNPLAVDLAVAQLDESIRKVNQNSPDQDQESAFELLRARHLAATVLADLGYDAFDVRSEPNRTDDQRREVLRRAASLDYNLFHVAVRLGQSAAINDRLQALAILKFLGTQSFNQTVGVQATKAFRRVVFTQAELEQAFSDNLSALETAVGRDELNLEEVSVLFHTLSASWHFFSKKQKKQARKRIKAISNRLTDRLNQRASSMDVTDVAGIESLVELLAMIQPFQPLLSKKGLAQLMGTVREKLHAAMPSIIAQNRTAIIDINLQLESEEDKKVISGLNEQKKLLLAQLDFLMSMATLACDDKDSLARAKEIKTSILHLLYELANVPDEANDRTVALQPIVADLKEKAGADAKELEEKEKELNKALARQLKQYAQLVRLQKELAITAPDKAARSSAQEELTRIFAEQLGKVAQITDQKQKANHLKQTIEILTGHQGIKDPTLGFVAMPELEFIFDDIIPAAMPEILKMVQSCGQHAQSLTIHTPGGGGIVVPDFGGTIDRSLHLKQRKTRKSRLKVGRHRHEGLAREGKLIAFENLIAANQEAIEQARASGKFSPELGKLCDQLLIMLTDYRNTELGTEQKGLIAFIDQLLTLERNQVVILQKKPGVSDSDRQNALDAYMKRSTSFAGASKGYVSKKYLKKLQAGDFNPAVDRIKTEKELAEREHFHKEIKDKFVYPLFPEQKKEAA
ncbi:MAG: hypothetical protein ABH823_03940 [bacterium]